MGGDLDRRAGGHQQFAGAVLDVGEAVYVELEHLGGVLHAQAVARAEVLIYSHPELTHGLDPSAPARVNAGEVGRTARFSIQFLGTRVSGGFN
ncbi:hypothetical protein CS0771_68110 [Catellatospora sp. IY07-71]|nr:hypothetical protein CS0771_68110 [Catellatospora sp. IY07-71]